MEILLLWLFYLSTLYAFIPGLITRIFGYHVFRHGADNGHFALTFDDGPDPIYTPLLLDLLKQFGAKATFFVVGSNAEKYPELVKRIHEEGHMIGIHNYIHKTNWIMGPAGVKKQIEKTNKVIHEITGMTTNYYRPPWGIVNLFDFAQRGDTQIVLWSAMFGDWRERVGADRLTQRMLKKLRGGEIFLLHDCGTTLGANNDAPGEMLIALETILKEAQRRGLQSIRIDEMIRESQALGHKSAKSVVPTGTAKKRKPVISRSKRWVVGAWLLWEKLFHFIFRLKTTNEEDPVFHFRVRPYHGNTVIMTGGVPLVHGDRVLEIHFDNKKLFQIGTRSKSSVQIAIQMIRGVEKTLPELAEYVVSHPELHDIKALYGVSMINRGPEQFGFTVADLPKGLFASSTKIYLKLLMSVIHPAGTSRLKQASAQAQMLSPKLIIMPIDFLISQYSIHGSQQKLVQKKQPGSEQEEEVVITPAPSVPCQ